MLACRRASEEYFIHFQSFAVSVFFFFYRGNRFDAQKPTRTIADFGCHILSGDTSVFPSAAKRVIRDTKVSLAGPSRPRLFPTRRLRRIHILTGRRVTSESDSSCTACQVGVNDLNNYRRVPRRIYFGRSPSTQRVLANIADWVVLKNDFILSSLFRRFRLL